MDANPQSIPERTEWIKHQAQVLGFHKVGITRADRIGSADRLMDWLARGYHADMAWMARDPVRRIEPQMLLPDARSIVVVGLNYYVSDHGASASSGTLAKISRYAWGDDYHQVLKWKLQTLLDRVQGRWPDVAGKICIDTSATMDKWWAAQAGIGWQGKHSNIISRDYGSWIFLGELLLTCELDADSPIPDFCGSCTRCLDACPTQAIVQPYLVDANRCLSYWTVEYRGETFPNDICDQLSNWVFGCDICQEVCPWNGRFQQPTDETAFTPRSAVTTSTGEQLADLSVEDYERYFKNSAIRRGKHSGLVRNAQVALKRRMPHG